MRAPGVLVALFTLLGVAGCGETNKQNYAQAAVGAGAELAMVGIYRALTKDCWAHCSPGYTCNQESGLCELGECRPGCEFGWHCVRNVAGDRYCTPDGNGAIPGGGRQVSTAPSGARPSPWLGLDAGAAFDAGSVADAGALTDAAIAADAALVPDASN